MPRKHKPVSAKAPAKVPAAHQAVVSHSTLNRAVILVLFLLPFVFYWKYLWGSNMLYGTDWLGAGGYMIREFMARYIKSHGWIAYWMPAILSGQPTGAAFFADLFYPTIFFRLVLPVHIVWTWTFVVQLFIAGLGTYLFLKELKAETLPAALAGVAYMFAGSLITLTYAGHDGRLIGSSFLPLALFFLHRGVDRRRFYYFVLMGLVLALQLLSGHIQKVYYTGMALVAYFLFVFIWTLRRERSPGLAFRLCSFFLVGIAFGIALSAIQYLPISATMPFASRGSERGYAYASSWSMPMFETFDLLTPRFSGGLDRYWGPNPFKLHSEYVGILPLLFAAVAVFRRWKDRFVRFFTITLAGTLLMAWGGETPFYYIPYYLFPGVSKFRGPAMIFFVAAFSLAVLAGLGIDHLLRELRVQDARKTRRTALIAAGVPLMLLLLFAVFRSPMIGLLKSATVPTQQKAAAIEANYPHALGGFLFATVVAAAGFALCHVLLRRRLKTLPFAVIAAGLMVLDVGIALRLWDGTHGYIRGAPRPAQYFAPDEVVSFLKSDTSLYRVLPVNYEPSDDGILMYHAIQSTGGQMPNPLQSYQDFIGAGQSVMFQAGNLMHPNFMKVANVKYVIGPTLPEDDSRYDERSQQAIRQLRDYFSRPGLERSFAGTRYSVYRNLGFLPRAFVAAQFELVQNKDEVISRLTSPSFDPAHTALLYENPGFAPAGESSAGTAEVSSYDCNELRIRAAMRSPGLLALSENYHPDWKAFVDGRRTHVLRAYHTFRAVPLEPGDHDVVFRYESLSYRAGAWITIASLVFLGATLAYAVVRRQRRPLPTAN